MNHEIVVEGQGKFVVSMDPKDKLKRALIGIESPCCSCVDPVFRLNQQQTVLLYRALGLAIAEMKGQA
jgi:hypothetical protein